MSIQRVSPDSIEPMTPGTEEDKESLEMGFGDISIPDKVITQIVSRSQMLKDILLRESPRGG